MELELAPEKKSIVYIGGYGQGKTTVHNVAAAIETYHKGNVAGIDPYTFSCAIKNPSILRRAIEGAEVYTLSAGFMALVNALEGKQDYLPGTIDAFNPPIPTSVPQLCGRTALKSWDMLSDTDKPAARSYSRSSAAEFSVHVPTLVSALFDISKFNAIKEARDMQSRGVPVDLAYTDKDRYFMPTDEQKAFAKDAGVRILYLAGVHDEVALRPEETFRLYMNAKASEI